MHTREEGFPDLDAIDVVLFGVTENRGSSRKGSAQASDAVRSWFYRLAQGEGAWRVADLGNIDPGEALEDTYFAISGTLEELIPKGILAVVLGGTADLLYAVQMGFTRMNRTTDLVFTGPELGIVEGEADQVNERNFLSKLVLHQGEHLFNYSHIGYQSYFTEKREEDMVEGLNFDIHRLGKVQQNIPGIEPVIRNGDIFGISMNAIRASEARAGTYPGPNGFYGDEVCQLTRYAGLSEKVKVLGVFDLDGEKDRPEGLTAGLVAQMIWYFVEGVYQRRAEDIYKDRSGFTRFIVEVEEGGEHNVVFYKSEKTDRWWMEVPYPGEEVSSYHRSYFIPCSYEDYLLASNGDIPDQWWRTYQKLTP